MGDYPSSSLGAGLQLIAEIIHADLGARILYVTVGGFDNHSGEDVDHDPLLVDVSDSIKAFFDDLDGHDKSKDVLLMTWSEFGRRAQDNGSNGTDHGTAAPHFVVGDAVIPGVHGGPPQLGGPGRQRESEDRERFSLVLRHDPLGLARRGLRRHPRRGLAEPRVPRQELRESGARRSAAREPDPRAASGLADRDPALTRPRRGNLIASAA